MIFESGAQFCAAFYHVHEWDFRSEGETISTRQHHCLDENNCLPAKKAKQSRKSRRWCAQSKVVVAVVKFEDNTRIRYEARYKNCHRRKKHAEDFFKIDVVEGELAEILQQDFKKRGKNLQKAKITLYLTLQPCNESITIRETRRTSADKSCCKTLATIYNENLRGMKIDLCVKVTHVSRLNLENATEGNTAQKNEKEILRQNAVEGIRGLMAVGVDVESMTAKDWEYLSGMVEFEVPQNDERRLHLDNQIHDILNRIKKEVPQPEI